MGFRLPLPIGCRGVWEAEAGSGGSDAVPWRDLVREPGYFENCAGIARRAAMGSVVQRAARL